MIQIDPGCCAKPNATTRLVATLGITLICASATLALGAEALPEPGIPQSCGVQLKSHNFTPQVIDQLHELGFRILRCGIHWDAVEKEKGVYVFSACDDPMQHARRRGITVVACLFGNNTLYEDDAQGGIQTEAGRRGFASFAAALAERYRDHDVVWEIWNEPKVRTFWRSGGEANSEEFATEYTALVKAVVPAMLKADPECFVVAGSVSNYWQPSYEWTEHCFNHGILTSGIRGWSVHPYGVKSPEEFATGHARMRELLKKYDAADLPLLNTERGFAVKQTSEGWSGGSIERASEFQAWHLVRQFLIDQIHGLPVTVWYEWEGEKFGLSHKGRRRPAWQACRVMLAELEGYRFVRRLPGDQQTDYALLFADERGNRKLVAWTAPPPGQTPSETREHTAIVEFVERPALEVVDIHGQTHQEPQVVGTLRLALSGAPQYVTVPKGAELGHCRTLSARIAPSQQNSAATGLVNQRLFDGANRWKFIKNTGQGSFSLGVADDGKPIGILRYDFTQSTSRSTPYVLASAPVNVPSGATAVEVSVRSPIAQRLTFRLIDGSGQTHQYKSEVAGSGAWETIRIPLNERLEHWGGAKDGNIHFPITEIVFAVPLPGEDAKTGKVQYANVAVARD